MSDVIHLFMCLLGFCLSSLEKCLFRSPTHLLIRLFVFFDIELPELFALVSCQLLCLKIFSPVVLRLFFSSYYGFLCCAKAFKFNQVPLVYFSFYFHYSRRWVIEDLALIYVIECSAYVFL